MWPFSRQRAIKSLEIEAKGSDSIENIKVPVSAENFLAHFGITSANLPSVTVDVALSVPSVLAAVAFLSRTLAALPLAAYRKTREEGARPLTGKIATVVGEFPNDGMDTAKFRQYFWQQVFTTGRGLAWIERTPQGVEAIWPMDPAATTVHRFGGKITYSYSDASGSREFAARDVIDVPFMLHHDGIRHLSPISMGAKAIQIAVAMGDYGANFFAGGGVPPLALEGPLPEGKAAMTRAMADIHRSIKEARESEKPIIGMPPGHKITQIGYDPQKGQMLDARRFQVEEIARIYQIPPMFLQDLTRANFSNSEQQDLHLVKHLIGQWAALLEGEMNLKLFGRSGTGRYVRHNLDALLRGDFATRMAGLAQAIQNSILTPNEARELENRPPKENGDELMVQGATVPLGKQPSVVEADNGGDALGNQNDGGGFSSPSPTADNDNSDDEADKAA